MQFSLTSSTFLTCESFKLFEKSYFVSAFCSIKNMMKNGFQTLSLLLKQAGMVWIRVFYSALSLRPAAEPVTAVSAHAAAAEVPSLLGFELTVPPAILRPPSPPPSSQQGPSTPPRARPPLSAPA